MIAFEGTLERDFFLRCEFDPAVRYFEGQPVRIDYVDETGRARYYTPDALVTYHDHPRTGPRRPRLCELKPHDVLRDKWAEYRPRFQAAQRYARERGWLFRVVSDRRVRTPYLENARFLLPYRDRRPVAENEAALLASLRTMRQAEVQTLLTACAATRDEQAVLLSSLWALVARFKVGCDLEVPVTMRSLLWWPDGQEEEGRR